MDDIWAWVHAERAALIADLSPLDVSQWEHPSLCAGWSVHDVVAHLVDSARTTRLGFVVGLAAARFDFDRQNARGVRRERRSTPTETLARLRDVATLTSTPPVPLDSRLVEEVVHGEDVRRPLGLVRDYPTEVVLRALRLQARTPAAMGGAKELLRQVRVSATDADLTCGTGSAVEGPALSLLLALTGRGAARADLRGPGLPALAPG